MSSKRLSPTSTGSRVRGNNWFEWRMRNLTSPCDVPHGYAVITARTAAQNEYNCREAAATPRSISSGHSAWMRSLFASSWALIFSTFRALPSTTHDCLTCDVRVWQILFQKSAYRRRGTAGAFFEAIVCHPLDCAGYLGSTLLTLATLTQRTKGRTVVAGRPTWQSGGGSAQSLPTFSTRFLSRDDCLNAWTDVFGQHFALSRQPRQSRDFVR